MRLLLISPAFMFLAACGSEASDPNKNILNATEQMDPAAAAAVENATAQGVDPQNALAIGGESSVAAAGKTGRSTARVGYPILADARVRIEALGGNFSENVRGRYALGEELDPAIATALVGRCLRVDHAKARGGSVDDVNVRAPEAGGAAAAHLARGAVGTDDGIRREDGRRNE